MFSLRAPTQPAKPRINVIPPTTRTSQTGSKPCSRVTWVKSNKTPYTHMWKSQQHVVIEPTAMVTSSERSSLTFSLQAQNPAAMKAAPASCNTRNTIKSERLPLPAFLIPPPGAQLTSLSVCRETGNFVSCCKKHNLLHTHAHHKGQLH